LGEGFPVTATKPLDLEAVKARCEKATEGPWCWENCGEKGNDVVVGIALDSQDRHIEGQIPADSDADADQVVARRTPLLGEATPADAAFIAHARTDIPALVAEVERLREALLNLLEHSLSCDCESCKGQFTNYRTAARAALGQGEGR
jgi:hypothetical protein